MAFTSRPGLRHRPPVVETLVENTNVKVETLMENTNVKIDRITARGQITPPGEFPDEPSHELIFLLKGQLVLEYEHEKEKVTLKPGEYAVKAPHHRTRADFTSKEKAVWLKVSWRGEPGRYPLFTGAVGFEEIRPKKVSKRWKAKKSRRSK